MSFGIFDEQNLLIEHPQDHLLLVDGTTPLNIFPSSATRDQRQFPDDGLRRWPVPIDLVRDWPDI